MLDKNSAMPLYMQAREVLEERISSGQYPEGSKIPSEKELCKEFGISRMTIRQVITWMARDGILHTIHGKGTYVAQPKIMFDSIGESNIAEQFEKIEEGLRCDNRVCEVGKYVCPKSIRKIMDLKPEDMVYRIETLGIVGSEPLRVGVSYIPIKFCEGMTESQLIKMMSSNNSDEYNKFKPYAIKYTVEAVSATKEDAIALQVQKGHPLLLCSVKYFNKSMQIYEYNMTMYLGEKVKLSFKEL